MQYLNIIKNALTSHVNKIIIVGYVLVVLSFMVFFLEHLLTVFFVPNLYIAPTMALGSFVAGSTFLGGGAVAFPAMTKILMTSPIVAAQFSLAIQSVGMTSASVFILKKLKSIPYKMLAIYLSGAAVGMLASLGWLRHLIPSVDIRVGFTVFILCFYVVFLLAKGSGNRRIRIDVKGVDILLILVAGFLGGVISGLLGSGADLVLFCVLSLYFRVDFKVSTQISIVAMAATSLIGLFFLGTFFEMSQYVLDLWVIAAPIVIVGAPLGAWFCMSVNKSYLFLLVSLLVLVEVVSTLLLIEIELSKIKYFVVVAIISMVMFHGLLIFSKFRLKKQC